MFKKEKNISKKAFTLTEMMLTVTILAIMTAFAIPSFSKSVRKAHERDAVSQLRILHAANLMYYSNNNSYLSGAGLDIGTINSNLGTNIIANGMTYSYSFTGANPFTVPAAHAVWDESGNANDFTVCIKQVEIDNTNPCCSAGSCPSLSACSNGCT